ncbi:MAG: type II secretion system protein GspM [Rhodospirillaceae bacterium]
MKQWWDERQPRERTLLMGLGAVTAALLLYQFALRPLVDYRRAAADSYASALEMLSEVEAGAADIQRAQSAAPMHTGATRTLVSTTAVELGVPITRLQPSENATLDVWLDDVAAPMLFTWIARLRERHGVSVLRATLQKNDGAGVRAQITFADRPGS